MFRSNKRQSIFLLAFLLPLGVNAHADVLTPTCISSIQSKQFHEKVSTLQSQNLFFMKSIDAIAQEKNISKSSDHAYILSLIFMQVSESMQLLETSTSLFPLLKFNNQDQITIDMLGRRNTFSKDGLIKIFEVLLESRVGIMGYAKNQIMNYSQGVKNPSLLRDINEMSKTVDELDKLLNPCK